VQKIDFYRYKVIRPYENLPLLLQQKTHQNLAIIIVFLDIFFYQIRKYIQEYGELRIPNFGTFYNVSFPRRKMVTRFRMSRNFHLCCDRFFLYCSSIMVILDKTRQYFCLKQTTIAKIFNYLIVALKNIIIETGIIKLRNFGFLYLVSYKRHHNLGNGKLIDVQQIRFKPVKDFYKQVNGAVQPPLKRIQRLININS
jgi:nucleoid DNA-binding protein